jgi:phosphoserine/homoserine phosphotransferase
MEQLGHPTLFCHSLVVDADDKVRDYRLRIQDGKRKAVMTLKLLNFGVVAAGDSTTTPRCSAKPVRDSLRPPDNVAREFAQFRSRAPTPSCAPRSSASPR